MKQNPILSRLRTYPQVEMNRRKRAVIDAGLPLYDFSVGDPREPTPAFIREAIAGAIPEMPQYPTVHGPAWLRQSIADYMERRFGVALNPETQILPSSGSKEVVFHLPILMIDRDAPDRAVIFPDPGYPTYERGTLFAGGEPIPQPLEGDFLQRPWTLPRETLQRARMMWINSPHNPSGATMSRDHLARIYDLCREHDILLVNDECYADIYDDQPPTSILEIGTEGALALHSLSKRSGMTGYRSGFIAGDEEVMVAFRTIRANFGVAPQDFVNAGAAAAWAEDSHAAARRGVFKAKRVLMRRFFREELGLEVLESDATFYLWVRCPDWADDPTYAARLLERGIVVSPGRSFGVTGTGAGRPGAGYFRVALVPSIDVCREAMTVWRQVHDGG